METPDNARNYIVYFFILYAISYMGNAVYGTFVPVYLKGIGYSQASIGTLLALGPFIATMAQPVWGMATDRAKTKNTILKVLFLGSAVVMAAYPLSTSFYYLIFATAMFTFFQTSLNPMTDVITLEYLEASRYKFGPIRMSGTIGYSIMAVIAGAIAKKSINYIFILYFTITIMAFCVVFRLPKVKGHQTKQNRVPIWRLFKNRELVTLMILSAILQITLGFYSNFFSLYYRQAGADNGMLGWAMFIAAMSEVPFLLLADRILNRIGIQMTILCSAALTAIRWMLLSAVTDSFIILLLQFMHGSSYIVLSYSMATYINREAPKELKASGQALYGLLSLGLARIIGSILGGVLSDAVGIRRVFLYNSILVIATAAAFGILFGVRKKINTDESKGTLYRI